MNRKRRYGGDPHWLFSLYGGSCSRCKAPIKVGDRIFYYPNTRTVLCGAEACGQAAARDFASCAFDEAVYNGGY